MEHFNDNEIIKLLQNSRKVKQQIIEIVFRYNTYFKSAKNEKSLILALLFENRKIDQKILEVFNV
jgi:hypothetical protein